MTHLVCMHPPRRRDHLGGPCSAATHSHAPCLLQSKGADGTLACGIFIAHDARAGTCAVSDSNVNGRGKEGRLRACRAQMTACFAGLQNRCACALGSGSSTKSADGALAHRLLVAHNACACTCLRRTKAAGG